MYPFGVSVDEHVPLNMGARRIFSDKGQNWIFQGQCSCRRRGAGGESATQMFWFIEIRAKMSPNVAWLQKMMPNVCRKTHESFFSRSHPKKGSLWEKICWQKSHKTFGKFGGLRATILRTPKKFPAPSLMSRDWPKISLQEEPKAEKFYFHHSKQRKQLFLQKIRWENV